MKAKRIIVGICLPVLAMVAAGCAPSKEPAKQGTGEIRHKIVDKLQEARRDRALNHFIQGAVFDAKGEHANAILEYQDALRDDPNPAIYYAISKDYSILGKHSLAAQAARAGQARPTDSAVGAGSPAASPPPSRRRAGPGTAPAAA